MAIKQRTLMDKSYLAEYSLLPNNYSIDEIWNFVALTETLHIEPIIGTDLYNELLDQVEQNNVTPENASLLLQIYPFEGLSLMEVAMPYIAYHFTEVGITVGKSENSEGISTKDINYITNYVRSQMDPLKEKLIDYLNRNKDVYPLYKPINRCNTKNWNAYGFKPINTDIDGNRMYMPDQFYLWNK